ncbi:GNAT family N-acetyltransferase [Rhodopseudomonas palustris]|uniref:GCN5-related N-acetyltransferase n=1 Tax=Rhodopseudomonas palustris (strain BisB18) TaxID=316056 RepID=Q21AN8_RHOPB
MAERLRLTRDNCPSHPSFTDQAVIRRSFGYGTVFLLTPDDGAACGCVGVRRPKDGICALEKLAVLPSARRHGLGRALVEAAAVVAADWGATQLEASIIASERDLARWYQSLGFVPLRTARFPQLPFEVKSCQEGRLTLVAAGFFVVRRPTVAPPGTTPPITWRRRTRSPCCQASTNC